jgi:hypothetical protein
MPSQAGKKKKSTPGKETKARRTTTKASPRTVRFPVDVDQWVDEQGKLRQGGATAVIVEAVLRYREQVDSTSKTILEAVT